MLVSDKVFYKVGNEEGFELLDINKYTLDLIKRDSNLNLADISEITWYIFAFVKGEIDYNYAEYDDETDEVVINIIEYVRYLNNNGQIKVTADDFDENWYAVLSSYVTFGFIDEDYKEVFNKFNII